MFEREEILRALLTGLALLLTSTAAGQAAGDMTFRLAKPRSCARICPVMVVAEGRITQDSYRSFDALARTLPRRVPVLLNSLGGDLIGGVRLGLTLRQHGAAAVVPRGAVCA